MRLRTTITAVVLLTAWWTAAVRADDAAGSAAALAMLKLVPSDAYGVFVVNHLDAAVQKFAFLAQEVQAPIPISIEMIKQASGASEGVDEHGPVGLVMLPSAKPDGDLLALFLVPVSDYDKLISSLGGKDAKAEVTEAEFFHHPVLIGHKDNFAVMAPSDSNKDDEEAALKKVLAGGKGIDEMAAPLVKWLDAHEAEFIATPAGIKAGSAAAQKGLEQLKETFAKTQQGAMSASGLDLYEQMLKGATKEFGVLATGLHLDEDGGLHVDVRTLLKPEGMWAKAGADAKPVEGPRLSRVPGGPFFMAFEGSMSGALSKNFFSMSADVIKSLAKESGGKQLTDEQMKKLDDAMGRAWSDGGVMQMVMGTPQPGASMYEHTFALLTVKDSAAFIAGYEKGIKEVNEIYKSLDLPMLKTMDIENITYEGKPGLHVAMDMKAMMKATAQPAASRKMLEQMWGPDGKMHIYLAPLDGTSIGMAYSKLDNLKALDEARKNPQSSLASDPDVQQTAKQLPPGSQWIGYISPKGLMDFTMGMAMNQMPPGMMPQLPPFPQTAPIGFAAKLDATTLDASIVIPGSVFKGVGQYIRQMQRQFAPQPQPGLPPQIQ